MSIKLITFDLDGTFLADDKSIPEKNIQALKYAYEKGVYVVPATGRHFNALPESIRSLPYIRYFILINGARVYDAQEDRTLSTCYMPNSTALALFENARPLHCSFDCYVDDRGYMDLALFNRLEEFITDPYYLAYVRSVRNPVEDLSAFVIERGCDIQKVQYYFNPQYLHERSEQLETLPVKFPGVRATSSVPGNIEINAADAGKGPALETLCSLLGFGVEDTIAFGDGTNDIDILQTAGMGISPSNAVPEVLEIADMITSSNNDAGVAEAIFKLLG